MADVEGTGRYGRRWGASGPTTGFRPLFEIDTAVDLNLLGGLKNRFRTNIGPNMMETVSVFCGTRTLPSITPLEVAL